MILLVLNAFLLISPIIQACAAGCLKCDSENECVFSDVSSFYKLNGTTAEKITISNCTIINIEGTCLACGEDYYLDNSTNKCISVPESSLIDDCIYYSSGKSCSSCDTGFYLTSNVCASIERTISNCELYMDATRCMKCNKGYLLAPDNLSCIAVPETENCSQYSFVKCQTCANGYVLNPNEYFNLLLRTSNTVEKNILGAFIRTVIGGSALTAEYPCEFESTYNCEESDSNSNVCKTCNSGYYLTTDKFCVEYPDEPLEGCLSYTTNKACIECISEHYFKAGGCTVISEESLIPECNAYDGTAMSIKCIKCSDSYYLSNNSCVKRIKSPLSKILNCAVKTVNADTCGSCNSSYIVTTDGLECQAKISDCVTYKPTISGDTLICEECSEGFYVQTITENINGASTTIIQCIQGDIENCAKYNANDPTKCETCTDAYVLQLDQCTRSVEISNCIDYSPNAFNTCLRCKEEDRFNFRIAIKCQMIINLTDNCIHYSGGSVTAPICSTCAAGYNLDSNMCREIPMANCLSLVSNKCTSCKEGFAVSVDGASCIAPLTHLTDNCFQISTDDAINTETSLTATCNVCKENAVPINYINNFACVPTSHLKQFSTTNTTVDGCVKYNQSMQCVQCDPTSAKPYLRAPDSPPSCNAQCNGSVASVYDKIVLETVNSSGIRGLISQINVCRTGAVTACLVKGPEVSTGTTTICLSCDTVSIPYIIMNETRYSSVNPFSTTLDDIFPSPFAKHPRVTCAKTADVVDMNASGTATLPSNCQYYIAVNVSTGAYACIKCNHRHTSKPNSSGYLATCELDTTFTTDVYYNLEMIWLFLFSGHVCVTATNIPFVGYTATSISNPTYTALQTWNSNLGAGATFASGTGAAKTVICADNAAASFGLTAGNYSVAANCGLGAIQVNTNGTGNNTTSLGSYCAACKPGFAPTVHGTYYFVVTACTSIANCATGTNMFNACSTCASGFILKYTTTVVFNSCLTVPAGLTTKLLNCYAASASATVVTEASTCQVCKKGYNLNADNFCEKILPGNCQENQYLAYELRPLADWNWAFWVTGTGVGCNKCAANYFAVKITINQAVCLKSSWVTDTVDTLTKAQTNFIPDCKNYVASTSSALCQTCETGYVIKGTSASVLTRTECYVSTNLPFCEIASSTTTCLKCTSAIYSLVNGTCALGNIVNCLEYANAVSAPALVCTKCNSGFYLETATSTCKVSMARNCMEAENNEANQCKVCKTGFTRASVGSNIKYCYPDEPTLGCGEFELTDSDVGGRVSCKTCANILKMVPVTVDVTSKQTICLKFSAIQNCKKYNLGDKITTSTFTCLQCNHRYYLDTNACTQRLNVPTKCKTFVADEDKCQECSSNSYLSNTAKECIDFPDGIIGCRTYTDAETCISCSEGRYLAENVCISVETPITKCVYYTNATTCLICESGYYLNNDICVKATAQNCTTYASIASCATCPSGAVLQLADGITSCIAKNKTGCLVININSPHGCLKCSNEFYLDSGECQAPNPIENCESYETKTTCAICNASYALSVDKTACLSDASISPFINSNCVNSVVLATPICTRCNPGFYFVEGACTGSCNIDVKGCFACKHTNPSVCYICSPDYYQGKDGSCTFFGTVIDSSDSYSRILRLTIVGVLIMFFK